ncbi:MAG TPA: hypothetical protein DCR93_23790 [Cytophagales bacterium]|nr:hypothetical protein [Cytophagales bacterium]HAP62389.1 hypothetical protein [Cytophagales bacterium]
MKVRKDIENVHHQGDFIRSNDFRIAAPELILSGSEKKHGAKGITHNRHPATVPGNARTTS